MLTRGSGILLHLTSLPGAGGVGSLGPDARRFVDFLAASGQRYWQMLPVTPTGAESAHSPYSSTSAFAGNPLLVSVEDLQEEGWLERTDAQPPRGLAADRADYARALRYKEKAIREAARRFTAAAEAKDDYERFCAEHEGWLEDYALFAALRRRFRGRGWLDWPRPIRDRERSALREARRGLEGDVTHERFAQWIFARQWSAIRRACREAGVLLIGDVPIYVRFDSADVWAHRDLFHLDGRGRPIGVTGVPPDYFSETGQLWGNPVYRWDVLEQDDYLWWQRRFERTFELFDLVRVDHFRGFVAYWEVPARARTAKHGHWVEGPGEKLFRVLARRVPQLPLIAEDLGVITPDVRELMQRLDFPGIRVLQFGFGDDSPTSVHAPHGHVSHAIVCPGTHDNNPARGWFEKEASAAQRQRLEAYVGRKLSPRTAADTLVQLALMSVANVAVIPMQDLLRLGEECRLNRPGTARGNWLWRLERRQLTEKLAERFRALTALYGRL